MELGYIEGSDEHSEYIASIRDKKRPKLWGTMIAVNRRSIDPRAAPHNQTRVFD
jgi:hypothetical protein